HRAGDRERIGARAERYLEDFQIRVRDAGGAHTKTRDRRRCHRTGIVSTVARIVDSHDIFAALTVDGQPAGYGIDIPTGIWRRTPDIDPIRAATGIEAVADARARRWNVDGITARTQTDIEVFQR